MRNFFYIFFLYCTFFISCRYIDVTAKTAGIPAHEWKRNQKALVELDVKDSALYNLYFIIRHSQKYKYNNIITRLTIEDTAKNQVGAMNLNVPLVKGNGDWNGRNMDDLYDNKIKIDTPVLLKHGKYRFIFQHEMKDDPLLYVLNVGVEIEKATAQ